MSRADLQPRHASDDHGPPGPLLDSRPSNAALLIESIGSGHVDVRAVGSFNMDSLDRITARLLKLTAGSSHLRIDFRNVSDMDHEVASLIHHAAMTVEAAGGKLDLVGLHTSIFHDDTTTSMESVHAPNPQRGTP